MTLPAAFIGHGHPLNTFEKNKFTDAWRTFAAGLAPRAILMISAHWYAGGTRVTAAARPRTVHDFTRYREKLFGFTYPAPGDLALARRVRNLLAPAPVTLDERWGFDHGAWVVLAHVAPAANVPVVQLSIDRTQPAAYHYELGQRLAPLRDEGVLILASGNVIHNQEISRNDVTGVAEGWEVRFDADARKRIERGDHAGLVAYDRLGTDARLAIPTPDHYLPLLYTLGLQRDREKPQFIVAGGDVDDLGMLSVAFG
jgi:4,5-DOPA dioxygenase extradiol